MKPSRQLPDRTLTDAERHLLEFTAAALGALLVRLRDDPASIAETARSILPELTRAFAAFQAECDGGAPPLALATLNGCPVDPPGPANRPGPNKRLPRLS